jgi:hypothetical protein
MTDDVPERVPPIEIERGTATEAGRPLVERIGLGAIAVVLAGVFAFIALAAWTSGELFLAVMAGIGALMTVWAAAVTLRRG